MMMRSALCLVLVGLLATHASALASLSTCPSHVKNCKPDLNQCRMCHHSCKYCQHFGHVEGGVCGSEDCMECLPGLRHDVLWDDETGRCTDEPETFLATCPGHVEGCSSHNMCAKCHSTCKYCQGDTSECGLKDCMQCADNTLVLWDIFTDETGECLPRGVSFERHELTCPESVPGCHFDNRCIECDPSCDTCQSTDTKDGICTPSDCWTCRAGHAKRVTRVDGRGVCEFVGETAKKADEERAGSDRVASDNAGGGVPAVGGGSGSSPSESAESSNSMFWFFLVVALLLGLYFFAKKFKDGQESQSPSKRRE